MIITFCGHSNCLFNNDVKEQLKNILLDEIIKNPTCKFYLGGYGDFDGLCLRTLKDLKADFPEIELIFITPYIDKNYSKLAVGELKELCTEKGIDTTGMKKADLVAALN